MTFCKLAKAPCHLWGNRPGHLVKNKTNWISAAFAPSSGSPSIGYNLSTILIDPDEGNGKQIIKWYSFHPTCD